MFSMKFERKKKNILKDYEKKKQNQRKIDKENSGFAFVGVFLMQFIVETVASFFWGCVCFGNICNQNRWCKFREKHCVNMNMRTFS